LGGETVAAEREGNISFLIFYVAFIVRHFFPDWSLIDPEIVFKTGFRHRDEFFAVSLMSGLPCLLWTLLSRSFVTLLLSSRA
jgi:hypothetical protein